MLTVFVYCQQLIWKKKCLQTLRLSKLKSTSCLFSLFQVGRHYQEKERQREKNKEDKEKVGG